MSSDALYEWTDHARRMTQERRIDPAWVERTLRQPRLVETDKIDPSLTHALAKIPEFGDRVLRVVYNSNVQPHRIVTVFFDRKMKGRL